MDIAAQGALLAGSGSLGAAVSVAVKNFFDGRRRKATDNAEYAGKAFEAWEALAGKYEAEMKRRDAREEQMTMEIRSLRAHVGRLEVVLATHGIQIPDAGVA